MHKTVFNSTKSASSNQLSSNEQTSSMISDQNDEYSKALLNDIIAENTKIEELMDTTAQQMRLNLMNSLKPPDRRRLMNGESLESITNNKYYNRYDNSKNIPEEFRFEYQISDHLLLYDIRDIEIEEGSKHIKLPVEINDMGNIVVKYYTIIEDESIEFITQLKDSLSKKNEPLPLPLPFTTNKEVLRIQKLSYESLCNILPTEEDQIKKYVYSNNVAKVIQSELDNERFPFEIVNAVVEQYI